MNNWNFEILKENIRKHMSEKRMTQKYVAEKLNTTQANIAKHLKKGDCAQTFTLKQVWLLADLFEVSIDELLGRSNTDKKYSLEELGKLFANLIQENNLVCVKYQTTEYVKNSEIPFSNAVQQECEYDAFYFPNHQQAVIRPKNSKNESMMWYQPDLGKAITANIAINKFLRKYIECNKKFKSGEIDEQEYQILLEAYYKILNL